LALKQISLSIASGEKVVLCGPSGSGKSSLIMAILRMIDVREGSISIDDTDISAVSGRDLRMHLNIVPQDPFFLPGTLKCNIDPREQASDQAIVEALDRVGLWGKFKTQGLDAELDTTALSHGERQLLCLARAMLVPSKILITDEATSRYG
jgi:ABC-type multidrug transport system fused ATPase/permease subunit